MPSRALSHLRRSDERLGEWIDRIGVIEFPRVAPQEPYLALLETIAHQQLAGAAARAIWTRVIALFDDGVLCPKQMAEMADDRLRSAGLSRGKTLSMKDICARMNAGKIPSAQLIGTMSDQLRTGNLARVHAGADIFHRQGLAAGQSRAAQ